MGPKEGQLNRHSKSVTPGLSGMKCGEGARPKDSFKRMSAFQDYTSIMMSALNNPWKPRSRKTATPTWSAVPPLVYLSATGTPVSETQSKKEAGEKYVPMNFSAVDKTVLTPQGRQEMTPDRLLEKEQTEWYQKGLKEAEEDMVQACLEKSKLEDKEVEIIKQRALKAQEEFEALERNEMKIKKYMIK